jgi:ABC-type uncharacterized transport system permease subunit
MVTKLNLRICSFSLLFRTGSRLGGWSLEEMKLRLTQPSYIKLGLGLSLAKREEEKNIPKIVATFVSACSQGQLTHSTRTNT